MQAPTERTRVVLCLFSVLFLGVADNQILSPLLPAIRSAFNRSTPSLGLLFTGYSLSAGLSVLLWGPLSDLIGARRALFAGLLGFAAGTAASYVASSFGAFLAARILTGTGASLLSLNTITYAAAYFPYKTRGWAMSSIFSSYFAALILGVPLAAAAAESLGWQKVFALECAAALALLALAARCLPGLGQPRPVRADQWGARASLYGYLAFFGNRATAGALCSAAAASGGMMALLAFVGVWLHDAFAASTRAIGLVFLASGGAALVASPLAGSLSDRVGKRGQFVAANTILAVLIGILPQLGWGIALFAVFCGISVCAAFRQGPLEALATEVVPEGQRGSFVALKNSSSQLGIALVAYASGHLFERAGYGAVCAFAAALNLLAAGTMLAFVRHKEL